MKGEQRRSMMLMNEERRKGVSPIIDTVGLLKEVLD
jgi:hypothetical protein